MNDSLRDTIKWYAGRVPGHSPVHGPGDRGDRERLHRDAALPGPGIRISAAAWFGLTGCLDPRGLTEFMVGLILGERYEIIAKLGSGGMSHVYQARDIS